MNQFSSLTEKSCIKETHEFFGNRIIGDSLGPCKWTFTVIMTPLLYASPGEISQSIIAYEKCMFWLNRILDDVTISMSDNELGMNLDEFAENVVLLTPDVPSDSHILQLLHSKLSSIAGKALSIDMATLQSSESPSVAMYNTATKSYNLPKMKDMTEKMYHDKPWWERSAFDYADLSAAAAEVDEELQDFLKLECPLAVLEASLVRAYAAETTGDSTAEIIKMPKKWSPKIV